MTSLIGILIGVAIPFMVALGINSDSALNTFSVNSALFIFLVAFVMQWIAFIPAFLLKTEKFYDLMGGLTFITIIWLAWSVKQEGILIDTLFAVFITIWAARLSLFLFSRVHKAGSDTRFDEIKRSAPRFLLTWTLQGTWVTLAAAPAIAVIMTNTRIDIPLLTYLGISIWIIGMLIEIVSDRQKSKFKANVANRNEFIRSGLWAKSRHPNYFGEWLLWVGISVMALPYLTGWQFASLISPVFIFVLLTRVSGVPMLEKKAEDRWGQREDYQQYKNDTPEFFPKIF